MEAEEENALVKDPLAAALAGPRALADSRQRQQPAPATSGRKIKVNLMAIRTKWFDDQLEASLGMPLGHLASAGDYVATTAKPGATPRQVVLLGAGMDSRAWRLKLPAGLRWFEIDRQDVLEAKELLLEAAGAEVEPTTPFRRSKSVNALLEAKIGTFDHHEAGVQYPLRAESWAGVAADLEDPSWVKTLADAGFDRSKPTVWIAEGLLMYLAPQRAQELLQEMAQASASGSALITVSVTEDVIKGLKANGTKSELLATWRFGCPADPTQVRHARTAVSTPNKYAYC